jgi:hypothetical protein
MPDSIYPLPNQSQTGGNRASIAKQCGGVATHGLSAPQGRAAANVIRFEISFAARSTTGKMVGNGVRGPKVAQERNSRRSCHSIEMRWGVAGVSPSAKADAVKRQGCDGNVGSAQGGTRRRRK